MAIDRPIAYRSPLLVKGSDAIPPPLLTSVPHLPKTCKPLRSRKILVALPR